MSLWKRADVAVTHAAPPSYELYDLESRQCHVFLESRWNRPALMLSRITVTFSRIGHSLTHLAPRQNCWYLNFWYVTVPITEIMVNLGAEQPCITR